MRKIMILFCMALCSCAHTEEQAVRHVVTAELMERYRVQEEQIELVEVQLDGHEPMVRAEIHEAGRAGVVRMFLCKVERRAETASPQTRWTVTTVEEGSPLSAPPTQ